MTKKEAAHSLSGEGVTEGREAEIKELRGALCDLYSWVESLPIKHPMQGHWRERARKILFESAATARPDGGVVEAKDLQKRADEIVQAVSKEFTSGRIQPFTFATKCVLRALSATGRGGWRPIETAPKDGTEILALHAGGARHVVSWEGFFWLQSVAMMEHQWEPTAFVKWMPLPTAPGKE